MDPRIAETAAAVVAFLAPYLADAGHAAAKEVGKTIITALERKFKGQPAAEGALQEIRADPQDEDNQATLEAQLRKALKRDADFLAELSALVEEIRPQVSITGDGNVVGDGNKTVVAKDGGVAVGGDVGGDIHLVHQEGGGAYVGGDVNVQNGDFVGRDKIVNTTTPPPGPRPDDLRSAYLNHLFETVGALSLTGVDPKAASDTEARLDLGAVYTGLLTLTPEERELAHQDPRAAPQSRDTGRRLSALAHLDKHPHLVLLGDPGSGKSTFVNFVALCLAGETLGREEANLARLTAPLPADDKDDEEQKPQPWTHGPLLPVRVVLRDFAARGLPPAGERATARHLWDFIAQELKAAALGDYERSLAQELLEQGGLLLLDGLDEVPEAERRREQIKQAVTDFAATFRRCRVLVTSRTYAYQQQAWRLPGFAEAVLAPFSSGQVRRFVDRWYAHIAQLRGLHPDDAQGRAELLKRAIFGSERLRSLAERPLLLTLMASLHAWRGGSLPEKREELYADTVDLLLDWWERPKMVRDAQGNVTVRQPSLAEWLRVDKDKVRSLLNEMAYRAHAAQPDEVGTADVSEGELLAALSHLSQNPEVKENPALLADYLSQRAGLLLPRGVGVYTFPHRTFQEYLAACYLTDQGYPEEVAELARTDPNRWREVALLAGAKAARGTASAIWSLVDALCHNDVGQDGILPEEDAWGALLAGQALVENANLAQVSARNRPKLERVRTHLAYHVLRADGLEGRLALPATERAAAGAALAKLGDPRFRADAWHLPDDPLLGFVRIPAGKFLMGTRAEDIPALLERFGGNREWYEMETPQHEVDLPEYYIGRYPVTVAQWRAFVQASGHQPADEDSLRDPDNHPVRYVTWHEARAYCDWLTGRLREWEETPEPLRALLVGAGGGPPWRVTLPSEAEWEKAARGGLRDNPYPAWVCPWGDEPDPNRANYDDTGIGATSAVGCFPGGASPYGVEDMSGNVWEWCRTKWENNYENYRGDDNLDGDAHRVLRGGSFDLFQRSVRCAFRSSYFPRLINWGLGFRLAVVVSPFPL